VFDDRVKLLFFGADLLVKLRIADGDGGLVSEAAQQRAIV